MAEDLNLVRVALDLLRPEANKARACANLIATLEKVVSVESYLAEVNAALVKVKDALPGAQAELARCQDDAEKVLLHANAEANSIVVTAQIEAARVTSEAVAQADYTKGKQAAETVVATALLADLSAKADAAREEYASTTRAHEAVLAETKALRDKVAGLA